MESPDIRAGMAMLIAALCAEGTSEIGNIRQIDRGYERIDERLRALGARIERVRRPSDAAGDAAGLARSEGAAMIHPIPPGTRDVLPDEMRELRALTDAPARGLRGGRLRRGVDARARVRGGAAPRRRARGGRRLSALFDEHGQVLALRSDMTIPIARLVATRFADDEGPLRLCYFAHAYRAVEQRAAASRASSCRAAWS